MSSRHDSQLPQKENKPRKETDVTEIQCLFDPHFICDEAEKSSDVSRVTQLVCGREEISTEQPGSRAIALNHPAILPTKENHC